MREANARDDRQELFLTHVRPHQGTIRRMAALYARGGSERDDLVAEILLQLWRSFERFRGEASFSTFLYRVALNTALLWTRRRASAPQVDERVAVEDLGRTPTRSFDDEDVRRLYAAIRELAPLDRALVLLALDENSHREIAAITGLSVDNVGVRLSRSRARLRKSLGREPSTTE